MKWFIFALFLILLSVGGQTQQNELHTLKESGNAFLSECNTTETLFQKGICMGYIVGLNDGIKVEAGLRDVTMPYCIPENVTNAQSMKVINKFINDNPAKAHMRTSVLATAALMDAFPCENAPKKK